MATDQAPPSLGFSRQEHWSGLPFSSPMHESEKWKWSHWVAGKFGLGIQNETGQRLTDFCQEKALVIANTRFQQQEMTLHMNITRWSTPKSDGLYSLQLKMKKLYTVSKNNTGNRLWLGSWTPYCQIQSYVEESRENHYVLNQIPYNYIVKVTK